MPSFPCKYARRQFATYCKVSAHMLPLCPFPQMRHRGTPVYAQMWPFKCRDWGIVGLMYERWSRHRLSGTDVRHSQSSRHGKPSAHRSPVRAFRKIRELWPTADNRIHFHRFSGYFSRTTPSVVQLGRRDPRLVLWRKGSMASCKCFFGRRRMMAVHRVNREMI